MLALLAAAGIRVLESLDAAEVDPFCPIAGALIVTPSLARDRRMHPSYSLCEPKLFTWTHRSLRLLILSLLC